MEGKEGRGRNETERLQEGEIMRLGKTLQNLGKTLQTLGKTLQNLGKTLHPLLIKPFIIKGFRGFLVRPTLLLFYYSRISKEKDCFTPRLMARLKQSTEE